MSDPPLSKKEKRKRDRQAKLLPSAAEANSGEDLPESSIGNVQDSPSTEPPPADPGRDDFETVPEPVKDNSELEGQFAHMNLSRPNTKDKKTLKSDGTLLTNHFAIEIDNDETTFYQYSVTIKAIARSSDNKSGATGSGSSGTVNTPAEPGARVRRRVLLLLIQQLQRDEIETAFASDFHHTLLASKSIQGHGRTLIHYYDEDEAQPRTGCSQFEVLLGDEKIINVDAVRNYLRGSSSKKGKQVENRIQDNEAPARCNEVVQAFNMIVSMSAYELNKRTPTLEPILAYNDGRKFYNIPQEIQFLKGTNRLEKEDGSDAAWQLDHGLIGLPGYLRSTRALRQANNPFLLNVNTAISHFYPGSPSANSTLNNFIIDRVNEHMTWYKIEKLVKGLRVKTTYMLSSPTAASLSGARNEANRERIFTVSGLPFTNKRKDYWDSRVGNGSPQARTVSFRDRDDQQQTVQAYFSNVHSTNVSSDEFVVRVGDSNFQPAGQLQILPGQCYKGQTTPIDQGCRNPEANLAMITNQGLNMYKIADTSSKHFGVKVSNEALTVNYSNLSPPAVTYDNNQFVRQPSWNLGGKKFCVTSKQKKTWTYVEIYNDESAPSDAQSVANFITRFRENLRGCGIGENISFIGGRVEDIAENVDAHRIGVRLDPESIEESLESWLQQFYSSQGQKPDLIVALLPGSKRVRKENGIIYPALKRWAELKADIATVCTLKQKQRNKDDSAWSIDDQYHGNLMVKVNMKFGQESVNHKLETKSPLLKKGTMLVGIDVTHPGEGAMERSPSIAAMVGSVDEHFNQFPASLHENPRLPTEGESGDAKEEIECLEAMLDERLKAWQEANGKINKTFQKPRKNAVATFANYALPPRIIIFRDGLSVEQFEICKQKEIPRLQASIKKCYDAAEQEIPEIMVICTVKRHHCRFYGHEGTNENDLRSDPKNPKSGVAVFEGVTHGDHQDFFLISQDAAKGTARPTHYVVLYNTFRKQYNFDKTGDLRDVTSRDIAQMVFELCYVYVRATKAVGLVPPSYYADLAADRARLYMERVYCPKEESDSDTIYDKNNPEHCCTLQLQPKTYDLCFMFGRCTSSVSLAAPAYIADKACDRARCFMRNHYVGHGPRDVWDRSATPIDLYVANAFKDKMDYL